MSSLLSHVRAQDLPVDSRAAQLYIAYRAIYPKAWSSALGVRWHFLTHPLITTLLYK